MTTPELKPAGEWICVSAATVRAIQSNAIAHARYQALTEAAEASRKIEFEQTRSIHGFIDTRDSFCIEKAILTLRDKT